MCPSLPYGIHGTKLHSAFTPAVTWHKFTVQVRYTTVVSPRIGSSTRLDLKQVRVDRVLRGDLACFRIVLEASEQRQVCDPERYA